MIRNTVAQFPPPKTFDDFWIIYQHAHSHPMTRFMHSVGLVVGLCFILYALWSSFAPILFLALSRDPFDVTLWRHSLSLFLASLDWRPLLAGPASTFFIAWLSHFTIEQNIPTFFSYPLWSIRAFFILVCRDTLGWLEQ